MTHPTFSVDRLDDIPFLVGVLRDLHLDAILESAMGTHGNTSLHSPVGNGLAVLIWLVYLLSAGDHRKVAVESWVAQHASVLSAVLGSPVTAMDFSDDRMSTLLSRLQQPTCWPALEEALFGRMVTVYDPGTERFHLDATTAYGYHTPDADGLMRMGFAKAGAPTGLAQVKLMGATTARGQLVACALASGNTADTPLYLPLIQRVRRQVGSGHLFVGDSKMAALAIRADLAAQGDTYLVPLPRTETGGKPEDWLAALAPGHQATQLVWRAAGGTRPPELQGGVWETTRSMQWGTQTWTERVLLVYSVPLAKKQQATLVRHVVMATKALQALTPPRQRGRTQFKDVASLQTAITAVLRREGVEGLLQVTSQEEPGVKGQPGRVVITAVTRDAEALAARQALLGWRVMVTNAEVSTLSATEALLIYREEYVVEHLFHVIKDAPVGIRPFWVRTDEQIRGLAYLLTLAARVLTYIEHRLHDALTTRGETLTGLHPGQPHITTDHPTAKRVLETITRHQPTRIGMTSEMGISYQVINLPPLLQRLIALLGLEHDLYSRLENTS